MEPINTPRVVTCCSVSQKPAPTSLRAPQVRAGPPVPDGGSPLVAKPNSGGARAPSESTAGNCKQCVCLWLCVLLGWDALRNVTLQNAAIFQCTAAPLVELAWSTVDTTTSCEMMHAKESFFCKSACLHQSPGYSMCRGKVTKESPASFAQHMCFGKC